MLDKMNKTNSVIFQRNLLDILRNIDTVTDGCTFDLGNGIRKGMQRFFISTNFYHHASDMDGL